MVRLAFGGGLPASWDTTESPDRWITGRDGLAASDKELLCILKHVAAAQAVDSGVETCELAELSRAQLPGPRKKLISNLSRLFSRMEPEIESEVWLDVLVDPARNRLAVTALMKPGEQLPGEKKMPTPGMDSMPHLALGTTLAVGSHCRSWGCAVPTKVEEQRGKLSVRWDVLVPPFRRIKILEVSPAVAQAAPLQPSYGLTASCTLTEACLLYTSPSPRDS
eukprot:TRINITY_DN9570_c0_g1_i1.p1 TRINITY_DN9570_c0_g1~~TRINITY_DN9570_c0_g1_i1.p1  ORF type:complete len:222 (-),score=32.40 TRINITY_DN9570_c0_g1_i1:167-832(-)